MQVIINLIQYVVVFAVPTFFGWVVLRRVVRESEWMTLLGGSVVIGVVALMALMNELRFLLEMNLAAWFAYKLLLMAALVMLVALRRPPAPPQFARAMRAWWQPALAIAGALTCGIYFGIPACKGFLYDAWWFHYPTAVHIQNIEHFPLTAPFAPDNMLYYHFGPDLLAATWSYSLLLPVQVGFAINIILLAPAGFLLACGLLIRVSRSFVAALAGACFLYVGGNLRFLLLPGQPAGDPLALLQAFNSQTVDGLLKLVFTPSHVVGIPCVLAALVVFRHLALRPGWLLAGLLGALLGALTLVAEWYALPLGGMLLVYAVWQIWRGCAPAGRRWHRTLVALLPVVVGGSWCLFNNSYLAGMFEQYWMKVGGIQARSEARQTLASINASADRALQQRALEDEAYVTARIGRLDRNVGPPAGAPSRDRLSRAARKIMREMEAQRNAAATRALSTMGPYQPAAPKLHIFKPTLKPPALLPLRLNLAHLGQVPSWGAAGATGSAHVALWSPVFLMEAFPVLGLGLPFGLWMAWRRRDPVIIALAVMGVLSIIPPVFLDWGFRSTDLLRFFTGAFSFSALLLGILIGRWCADSRLLVRAVAVITTACCLINAAGLGLIGLNPSTFAAVDRINEQGGSLAAAVTQERSTVGRAPDLLPPPGGSTATAVNPTMNRAAFEALAVRLGQVLYPLTHGRDNVVVIVPPDQLPPRQQFPEWLKMATLSRVQLPIGWFWNQSLYTALYREAAERLDRNALAGLDAKWVVVSNVFGSLPSPVVTLALQDDSRFIPVGTLFEGDYYMTIYRVL